jgi:hypothetical protein
MVRPQGGHAGPILGKLSMEPQSAQPGSPPGALGWTCPGPVGAVRKALARARPLIYNEKNGNQPAGAAASRMDRGS